MTTIEKAGYIIQNESFTAILGGGDTLEDAWAEAIAAGATDDCVACGATKSLIDMFRKDGGYIIWSHIDRIACTALEAVIGSHYEEEEREAKPSVYVAPTHVSLIIDFQDLQFDFFPDKTINENILYASTLVASDCLNTLNACYETNAGRGMVGVSSAAFDDAFFQFDLCSMVKGAAHEVATKWRHDLRKEKRDEIIEDMKALRDSLKSALDILDDAVLNPEKYE